MPDPRVALTWEGPVALITIFRPEKLNALDLDMLDSLDDACGEIEGNHAARAAVITGEGKAFSTGGDIRAWAALLPHEFGFDWVRVGHRVFSRIAELRVPLIAALGGHALGGGLELAACADIRIAEPATRLGMPEKTIRLARQVMSTKPPAPAVTWGRTPRRETLTEPCRSICKNESSEASKPPPWK